MILGELDTERERWGGVREGKVRSARVHMVHRIHGAPARHSLVTHPGVQLYVFSKLVYA